MCRAAPKKPVYDEPAVGLLNSSISGGSGIGIPGSKKASGINGLASQMGGGSNFPFSQDESMAEVEEEDNCAVCQEKRPDAWIACDTCDKWFHYGCVGVTTETAPAGDEQYHCPQCRIAGAGGSTAQAMAMKRGLSEMPAQNIFDD